MTSFATSPRLAGMTRTRSLDQQGDAVANQLTLTVGANTATIPLAGSNAKINGTILRFLAFRNISTAGMTATQIGEALLQELKKIVIEGSVDVQREELLAEQRAALEATLAGDNAL